MVLNREISSFENSVVPDQLACMQADKDPYFLESFVHLNWYIAVVALN